MRQFAFAIFFALTCSVAIASEPESEEPVGVEEVAEPTPAPQRVSVPSKNAIRLNYDYPPWNTNPRKADSASILLREGKTGRVVKIQLQETGPNTGAFAGVYSVTWSKIQELQPELYIPEQSLLNSPNGLIKTAGLIKAGKLKRKPFILHKPASGGLPRVEVFENKAQARMALKTYKAEQALALAKAKVPSDTEVDTAKIALRAERREAAEQAARERAAIELAENAKLQEKIRAFNTLSEKEKRSRRAQAEAAHAEAVRLFAESKFDEAAKKSEQSIDWDPTNSKYRYQYALALFRLEQTNKSYVYFAFAEDGKIDTEEKNFYQGLIGQKLKDSRLAAHHFGAVAALKGRYAAQAEFYRGLIYYEDQRWEASQESFQKVLDISEDPNLDKQAEAYIEFILRTKQFEAERAKKWTVSLTAGEQYDDNVVSSSDSTRDSGTATDLAGYRTLLMGGLNYRPVYEQNKEWAINSTALYMYTVNTSFQEVQSQRNADPFMVTITAPFTHKGILLGKGHKMDIVPGYETIYMSVEDNTTKEILNSYILNWNNTIVHGQSWFGMYNWEMRQDNSKLNSSTGDNDSNAFKAKFYYANMFMLGEEKNKIVTLDFGLTQNIAFGKNSSYDRYDLSASMVAPFKWWEMSYMTKIGYYNQAYIKKADNRRDNNYAFTFGLIKKIDDIFSSALMTNYTINNSNVDASQYKKMTALLTITASKQF